MGDPPLPRRQRSGPIRELGLFYDALLAGGVSPADDAHLERMESLCTAVYEDLGLVEG